MKNYPLLLLLFCCTLFFTACSDDDDEAPSKEQMLQDKRWQITALEASTLFGDIDFYADLEDCQKDNYVEFRDNGVLVVNEGATKCDDSDPQEAQGTWSLNGDVLQISGIGASFGLPVNDLELTITELTASSLSADFKQNVSGFDIDGTVTMETM
ncbi:lipocalin family protein [Rufibacter aurantiacus]|uniref:lipocalin family protein n=1 Tax=Rufibacter aurantiacus TaxID=2817374 RepID=UPI001B304060|nr:lipocalin family protein [Rufibacter aurantiacus]